MTAAVQKWALLIGISRYPQIPGANLDGPENDVKGYVALLTERFGFPVQQITVLVNQDATRQAIIDALMALTGRVGPGDVVLVAYSGHGSQRLERASDANTVTQWGAALAKEADGLQETLVPYDSGRGAHPNQDLTDHELHALLAPLTARTPNVTVILDCCHSAGALRDPFGGQVRGLPADRRPEVTRTEATRSAVTRSPQRRAECGSSPPRTVLPYALLAACRSDEKAYELTLSGGPTATTYGALSYFLQREFGRCAAGTSLRDILARVSVEVNRQRPQQHPQGEGRLDQELFGCRELPRAAGVRVQERRGIAVTLAAGHIHGVTVGSRYAVSPAGKTPTLLTITQVDAAAAQAVITQESDPAACAVGAYASEVTRALGPSRFTVSLAALAGTPEASALRAALERVPQVTLAEAGSAARIYLLAPRAAAAPTGAVPQLGGLARPTWAVVGGDGELLLPPLLADRPENAAALAGNLKKLACLRAVADIDNPNRASALRDRFAVQLLRQTSAGGWEAAPEVLGEGAHFRSEERFAIAIKSHAAVPVYIAVLDLGVSGSISVIHPFGGDASERLAPGGSFALGTQEMEELRLVLPEEGQLLTRRPSAPGAESSQWVGQETLLFFFSEMPVDFSPLEQLGFERLPRRLPAPLRLLASALTGRDRDFDLEPAEEKDWTVVRKGVQLRAAVD